MKNLIQLAGFLVLISFISCKKDSSLPIFTEAEYKDKLISSISLSPSTSSSFNNFESIKTIKDFNTYKEAYEFFSNLKFEPSRGVTTLVLDEAASMIANKKPSGGGVNNLTGPYYDTRIYTAPVSDDAHVSGSMTGSVTCVYTARLCRVYAYWLNTNGTKTYTGGDWSAAAPSPQTLLYSGLGTPTSQVPTPVAGRGGGALNGAIQGTTNIAGALFTFSVTSSANYSAESAPQMPVSTIGVTHSMTASTGSVTPSQPPL